MVVKVKLPNKESGTEPVVAEDQDAPIVGKDVEWKQEGTINDGHDEAEPKGDLPKKQADSDGKPETPPIDSSGTGSESNLTMPDLPDSPPLDAYADDVPWDDTDTDGAGADAPPQQTGTTEAEQAQSDQQAESEIPDKEEEGKEQEPEGEALEPESVCIDELVDEEPTQQVAMTEAQQMTSHGETISTDHKTTMHEVPAPSTKPMELAKVRYSCGFTKNIGEFNSVRAEVAIELPCLPLEAEIASAYDKAVELVDSRLQELYQQSDVQVAAEPTPSAAPEPVPMQQSSGINVPPPPPE